MQVPLGEVVALLETPAGQLVADRRETVYRVPEWVKDPFLAAGVAVELPTSGGVIAGQYAIVASPPPVRP